MLNILGGESRQVTPVCHAFSGGNGYEGIAFLLDQFAGSGLADPSSKDLETAAFNVFLYGQMIGAAAEIDDHLNRGRNMDTRTAPEKCGFVV